MKLFCNCKVLSNDLWLYYQSMRLSLQSLEWSSNEWWEWIAWHKIQKSHVGWWSCLEYGANHMASVSGHTQKFERAQKQSYEHTGGTRSQRDRMCPYYRSRLCPYNAIARTAACRRFMINICNFVAELTHIISVMPEQSFVTNRQYSERN